MAMTTVTGSDRAEAEVEAPLLDDGVVRGSVDFKGRPAARSKTGCWKSAWFIIGVGMADRFAFFGVRSDLINYLTGPMGQSTATAASNVNAWSGVAMLLPLLGAVVADSGLGKYRTITMASALYVMGMGFLSVSAAFRSFYSANCGKDTSLVCSPSLLEDMAFFFAIYLVAFGQGGFRPCVQAFGAEQFDENDNGECKAKSSYFNWWSFAINGGNLVAFIVLSYIQENLSWAVGFGIPCIFMCLTLVLFWLRSPTYRFHIINSDDGNPFARIGRAFVKAARNRPGGPVEEEVGGILATNCSKEERDMEDAKTILRLVPIWLLSLGYAMVYAQAGTLFIKQGSTMDRTIIRGFQIPSASLQSLISVSVILCIPIYDRLLVPVMRAMTKKPTGITMLQRIGTGMFLSLITMVVAALIDRRRLAVAAEYGLVDKPNSVIPMSLWWLAPQYLLFGISEVFAIVGLQEFFYDQVPSELKSIGVALYLSIFGLGNILSSFLIPFIEKVTGGDGHGDGWFSNNLNRAHIDYFYWLLAGVNAVCLIGYVHFAKCYVYRSRRYT